MPSSVLISGRLQGVFTLLPVARAQLVGLQGIEHPQYFLGAAADTEIRYVDEADHALGIEDAEAAGELALDVGEHGKGERAQLVLLAAPGEMHELAVDAHTEQLRIARPELLIELAE